jgi:F0F1-type ATP synthase assembly protein I
MFMFLTGEVVSAAVVIVVYVVLIVVVVDGEIDAGVSGARSVLNSTAAMIVIELLSARRVLNSTIAVIEYD